MHSKQQGQEKFQLSTEKYTLGAYIVEESRIWTIKLSSDRSRRDLAEKAYMRELATITNEIHGFEIKVHIY